MTDEQLVSVLKTVIWAIALVGCVLAFKPIVDSLVRLRERELRENRDESNRHNTNRRPGSQRRHLLSLVLIPLLQLAVLASR